MIMVDFIVKYWGTALIIAILAVIVGLIIRSMVKNKKSGNSSCGCGCGCENCPSSGMCHKD